MKQETIEQLMRIAGFEEKCCVALMADQVKAMLEVAYEAGQRDLSFLATPDPHIKTNDVFIQEPDGSLRPIYTGQ